MPAVRVFADPATPACASAVDATVLRALSTAGRTLVVMTNAPAAPVYTLYRIAAATDIDDTDAVVLLECGGARAAVFFPGMPELGLDCARERVAAAFARADALAPRDTLTVKATQLIHSLDAWRAARACVLPSEHARAAIFWALAAVVYAAWRWWSRRGHA